MSKQSIYDQVIDAASRPALGKFRVEACHRDGVTEHIGIAIADPDDAFIIDVREGCPILCFKVSRSEHVMTNNSSPLLRSKRYPGGRS